MTQNIPLAEQLRPTRLSEYIGQGHIIGPNAILKKAIEAGKIPSMILWGPPGVGKTTLAFIISKELQIPFFTLSAVNSGVKDVRAVFGQVKESGNHAILFIDEIHRFSKSQQDSLLGAVEKGIVSLIGATTENPSFEVISPLLSRCQVYILKPLAEDELNTILEKARLFAESLYNKTIILEEKEALLQVSGGDARKLINAFELVTENLMTSADEVHINNELTLKIIQQNIALYDKSGEMHYDIISAFIKSLRGSDPNAAVYWLARMCEAGEKPEFIARRMLILASEDIGNANPNALLLANNCFQAVHAIGYPECELILAQTAVYLACSPKSNASYMALLQAKQAVREQGTQPVPLHLRNTPTKLMKEIGYGKGYQYAHDYKDNFAQQEFLPDKLKNTQFYNPQANAREEEMRKFLKYRWKEKYGY